MTGMTRPAAIVLRPQLFLGYSGETEVPDTTIAAAGTRDHSAQAGKSARMCGEAARGAA